MGSLDDKDSLRRPNRTRALKRLDSFDDLDIDQTRTEPLKRLWSLERPGLQRWPYPPWPHKLLGPLGDRDFCWGSNATGALGINLYLYLHLYLLIFVLIHILRSDGAMC